MDLWICVSPRVHGALCSLAWTLISHSRAFEVVWMSGEKNGTGPSFKGVTIPNTYYICPIKVHRLTDEPSEGFDFIKLKLRSSEL